MDQHTVYITGWILFCVCLLSATVLRLQVTETFVLPRAIAYPSKDFATEQRLPDDIAWMAQPSKCFSCERDMLSRFPNHPEEVYRAKKTKCFSCE